MISPILYTYLSISNAVDGWPWEPGVDFKEFLISRNFPSVLIHMNEIGRVRSMIFSLASQLHPPPHHHSYKVIYTLAQSTSTEAQNTVVIVDREDLDSAQCMKNKKNRKKNKHLQSQVRICHLECLLQTSV